MHGPAVITVIRKTNLVIGCGNRPKAGAVNLDMFELPGVDVVHDLEDLPLPFENDRFSHIEAEDVMEHVDNIVGIMADLWRTLKPGGTIWIRGPHAAYPLQAWKDPTHRRLFVPESFDNWDPTTYYGKHYGYMFHLDKYKFKVLSREEKNEGMEFLLQKV